MPDGKYVVLTGASGSGKTTIAEALRSRHTALNVFLFDSIGVPGAEAMAAYGSGHQPGGAWQRAMTLDWIGRIAALTQNGKPALFEGQMRIAFILEAFALHGVDEGKILLIDCDDATRRERLTQHRGQPELAHEHMMHWAAYLREEAHANACEIVNTGKLTLSASCSLVLERLGLAHQ